MVRDGDERARREQQSNRLTMRHGVLRVHEAYRGRDQHPDSSEESLPTGLRPPPLDTTPLPLQGALLTAWPKEVTTKPYRPEAGRHINGIIRRSTRTHLLRPMRRSPLWISPRELARSRATSDHGASRIPSRPRECEQTLSKQHSTRLLTAVKGVGRRQSPSSTPAEAEGRLPSCVEAPQRCARTVMATRATCSSPLGDRPRYEHTRVVIVRRSNSCVRSSPAAAAAATAAAI
jgi:hypothetical protein